MIKKKLINISLEKVLPLRIGGEGTSFSELGNSIFKLKVLIHKSAG